MYEKLYEENKGLLWYWAKRYKTTSGLRLSNIPQKILNDRAFGTFAATEWHRLYAPYVPMQTGVLAEKAVSIEPWQITHNAPYAHYQYEGKAYSGTPSKHPNGKRLSYSKAPHPKASAKWDKAAAPTQLPKLVSSLQEYIDSGKLDLD